MTARLLRDALPHAVEWKGGVTPARLTVDAPQWRTITEELAANRNWVMVSHWAEPDAVHVALLDTRDYAAAIVTLPCTTPHYPSIGRLHPPAIRFERTIRDLYGLEPVGMPDKRPWLDHGKWVTRPPHAGEKDPAAPRAAYPFLPADGAGLHQIAVGPVHAGIIEPGHFRFTANGETVVRLEERLGYVHKGIESLWRGAEIDKGGRLAARLSGDSTVANSFAFARAVETALKVAIPRRAQWLRALMAELERTANHLGDIGAICNDASFTLIQAHCSVLRERILRACDAAFGHRLMMDRVVPGGVTGDLSKGAQTAIRDAIDVVEREFPPLVELYDDTPSLQDRTVGTGKLQPELATQYAAGGFVGRASGRVFDARLHTSYAPYDEFKFAVPVRIDGDVNERVWIRILEIDESLSLIKRLSTETPNGATRVDLPRGGAGMKEGAALVEGFRGDIFAWIRLDEDDRIAHCHMRDPSWFQWPLLEAAVEGNIVADFPLCNKSFNCSYAGHDG